MPDKYTLVECGDSLVLKRNETKIYCPVASGSSRCGTWCPAFFLNVFSSSGAKEVTLQCFPSAIGFVIEDGDPNA